MTKSANVYFLLIQFSNKSKSWLQQVLRNTNILSAHVGNSAWLHRRWWRYSCLVADEKNRPDGATGLCSAVSRPAWGRAWIRKRRSGRYLTSDTLTPHSRNSAQKRIAELFALLWKSGTSNLTWLFLWHGEQRRPPQQTGPAKGINGFGPYKQTLDMSKQFILNVGMSLSAI